MLTKFKPILLMVAALAVSAQAQQSKPLISADGHPVPNDDGGKAFIIERSEPLSGFGITQKGVISEPQQYSIFVGSGWTNSSLHERETTLGNLLANVSDDSTIETLQSLGIKNRFGPTFNLEQTDVGGGVFRDLDAQRLLATLMNSGTIGQPAGTTIYMIFLESSLQSTLGALTAGKHYLAYYSAFTITGATVRYVVVPFESDASKGYQIALRALVSAATRRSQLAK